MSIRNLSTSDVMRLPQKGNEQPDARRCLSFVFDGGYLRPFKVLIYSLAKTRSFLDLPIIVFSQDKSVANDPIVNLVSDEVRLITEDDITKFSGLSRERIKQEYQLDWIPKYTFLKWLIFDDYDFDEMIFIDADIVCIKNANKLLDIDRGMEADMVGGPVFSQHFFKDNDENPLQDHIVFRNVRNLCSASLDYSEMRLNTGVLKIRKKALTKDFRERLLDFASRRNFVNEQSYLTSFFRTADDLKLRFMPAIYNYGAGSLEFLPIHQQIQILGDVAFLHFPGPKKPWLGEVNDQTRLSHIIWRKAEAEAKRKSRLFGERRRLTDIITGADM